MTMANFELSIQIKLFVIIVLCLFILYFLTTKKEEPDCEIITEVPTDNKIYKPQTIKAEDTVIRLPFDKVKYEMFKSSLDYDNSIPSSKKNDKLPEYLRKNIEKIVESGTSITLDLAANSSANEKTNKKISEFNNLVKVCEKLLMNTYISNPHIISLKI